MHRPGWNCVIVVSCLAVDAAMRMLSLFSLVQGKATGKTKTHGNPRKILVCSCCACNFEGHCTISGDTKLIAQFHERKTPWAWQYYVHTPGNAVAWLFTLFMFSIVASKCEGS